MIKPEYIIPFLTLFFGYYLGKRGWKKQFNLKHFDLHEEVLNSIKNIFHDDEFGRYYFTLSNKEINKRIKNFSVLSDKQYFKKNKIGNQFLPVDYFPIETIVGDVESLINKLRKLSARSNRKISKLLKNIIGIYDGGIQGLDFEVEFLIDSYNVDLISGPTEEENKYIKYLSNTRKELILLKSIALIKNLEKELENFLKRKE